jgi:hypothetical protein
MKDWIQEHYPGWDKLNYKVLREAVQQAWDAIKW